MAKVKKEKLSLEELVEKALVPREEQPLDIATNWIWTYIGNIAFVTKLAGFEYTKYIAPNLVPNGVPLFKGKNVKNGELIYDFESFIPKDISDGLIRSKVNKKCLLTPYVGAIGNVAIFNGDMECHLGSNVGKIEVFNTDRVFLIEEYMLYYLRSDIGYKELTKHKKATAQESISIEAIRNVCVPLPPFAEQQRIVAVIESLFEKLDTAKELAQNALDSFGNRKAAILHKAFTGELTAKWREENVTNTPKEIFNSIKKERMELEVCSKEVCSLLDNCDVEEMTDSNNWLRLKAMVICENITCGGTPTGHITESGEIPFLKVYNIVNNNIGFEYRAQFINSDINEGKLKSSMLKPGDVVMNIVGPPLRKIAIIPDTYQKWNMNQAIVRFRTIPYVNNKYMYYCLINSDTLDEVIGATKGVVGQANISITQSRNLDIPIPSKEEQKEIVRILDNLLGNEQRAKELCDVIEKIDLMKKAILARAFRGELGTNDPEEESAVELLKEVLKEKI